MGMIDEADNSLRFITVEYKALLVVSARLTKGKKQVDVV